MDIYFILVEPAVPENVGASARAIKTMSFNKLRLVNPCNHLSMEARKLAHGSIDVLTAATVFSTLEQAIADLDFVIGTSAKTRRVKHDYYPVDQLPDLIVKKGNLAKNIGIVFGREESGLSNEEIHQCDLISFVPMAESYPSLNLSHAVMIIAYELAGMNRGVQKSTLTRPDDLTLKRARLELEEILSWLGVKSNVTLYNRILERISSAGEDDLHLLYSVGKYFRENSKRLPH